MIGMVFSGFGGQGILTTGQIAAEVGMGLGMNVTWYPSYGAQMRGGTANCNVKISEKKIASPYVKKIDILVAMNVAAVDKFQGSMNPGGLIFVDADNVPENHEIRSDVKVVRVPVNEIANECGNPRGATLVMLGALSAHSDIFDLDKLISLVDEFFEKKGKFNPKNRLCLEEGSKC